MRANTRWTRTRYRLVRITRRLEILASPLLGVVTFVAVLLAGWVVLCGVAVLLTPIAVRFWWQDRRTRTLWPQPNRDCIWISGKTPRQVAENVSRDRRFTSREGILND